MQRGDMLVQIGAQTLPGPKKRKGEEGDEGLWPKPIETTVQLREAIAAECRRGVGVILAKVKVGMTITGTRGIIIVNVTEGATSADTLPIENTLLALPDGTRIGRFVRLSQGHTDRWVITRVRGTHKLRAGDPIHRARHRCTLTVARQWAWQRAHDATAGPQEGEDERRGRKQIKEWSQRRGGAAESDTAAGTRPAPTQGTNWETALTQGQAPSRAVERRYPTITVDIRRTLIKLGAEACRSSMHKAHGVYGRLGRDWHAVDERAYTEVMLSRTNLTAASRRFYVMQEKELYTRTGTQQRNKPANRIEAALHEYLAAQPEFDPQNKSCLYGCEHRGGPMRVNAIETRDGSKWAVLPVGW